MSEPKIESLQRVYWAVQRRDAQALSRLLSHDIEWTLPETLPWGGTHHGPAGVQTVAEIYEEHIEGVWADPDDFLDAGDSIVVLGRVRGRGRTSGREFDVAFAHVWGMAEGVPSRFRGYFDTAPIAAALEGA